MQQSGGGVGNPFAYGDRPQMGLDVEFGADPASGAFFQSDGRKHDDLKQMLDSNKDGLKLEAMKRIIGMIARGRDAGDLFPAVVKNVVSKNIEVKKLVYVYLVRYAEEQQDLALLSISTFQRALKDPNQLIRASALRVLSSIRVNMIVPIVMLAIRDSASDMSPYVRKTAAHAIPKLYSLDPEQKDELVTVIEKLLSDRTTLVVGSAVMAFDEVCPERVDLIHKNYRQLCNLLVDVDEWGQVIIINMLTRYARTQFLDPNADESVDNDAAIEAARSNNQKFYDDSTENSASASSSSSSTDESTDNENKEKRSAKKKSKKNNVSKSAPISLSPNSHSHSNSTSSSSYHVDLDHRLLLRQAKPLLQSRNASVVMAVSQLYHHIAPRNEVQLIAKALIRLLRSHKEVQSVVLTCIASMSTKRKAIFEPYVKSFFVRTSDPTHIKLLKLDILTNLASASSISVILREFQTYISSSDRSFVAATIQAIGRCAASLKEVTETCLNGLVHLLSNHDEHVVAESVVVIKKLLQTKAAEHYEIISQMAKLLDFITVSAARASIIWLIGEYNEKVPKIAPDVLRKMAKTFADEEDAVKLQILNLGVKLYLTNADQTSLLCQYVFTLARYDANYDIRDRARLLRQFIFPANGQDTVLSRNARTIFLSSKPAPALERKYLERDNFQLGSLSHYLNIRATGYKDLPAFPKVAPDASVRSVEGFLQETTTTTATTTNSASASTSKSQKQQKHKQAKQDKENNKNKTNKNNEKNFYADSDGNSSSDYSNSPSASKSSSSSSSSSETVSGSESDTESSSSSSRSNPVPSSTDVVAKKKNKTEAGSVNTIVKTAPTAHSTTKEVSNSKKTIESHNDGNVANVTGTSDSESSSYESNESSDSNSESNDEARQQDKKQADVPKKTTTAVEQKNNLDLLLDLDDIPPIGPVMTPSMGGFLTPGTQFGGSVGSGIVGLLPQNAANRIELVGSTYTEFKHKELLNKLSGQGLQVNYRYTRAPHLYSAAMVSIELQFVNQSNDDLLNIQMGKKSLPPGISLNEFAVIPKLASKQMSSGILGIDFNDTTHAIDFEITHSSGVEGSTKTAARVTLKPPIGELIRSVLISESYFQEQRATLRGMNEHQCRLDRRITKDFFNVGLKQRICECINVASIKSLSKTDDDGNILYFAGQTLSSKSLVLITVNCEQCTSVSDGDDGGAGDELSVLLTVNCEKMVIGSMVLNELRNAFASNK